MDLQIDDNFLDTHRNMSVEIEGGPSDEVKRFKGTINGSTHTQTL